MEAEIGLVSNEKCGKREGQTDRQMTGRQRLRDGSETGRGLSLDEKKHRRHLELGR